MWIHDCDIWAQDDCISVKDHHGHGSYSMLFERINASGTGLVIGSIGASEVRNITFRDSYLHRSWKGIFMKFRTGQPEVRTGLIEDITYENIVIEGATNWPIWIGPAQQAISSNPCHPSPCSLCWPQLAPFGVAECYVPEANFRNILFRNIRMRNTKVSPGVIRGYRSQDMGSYIENITFDNVYVTDECDDNTLHDRYESFPGLLEPIDDPYMFTFRCYVVSIIVAIVLLPVLLFLICFVQCCELRKRRRCVCKFYDCCVRQEKSGRRIFCTNVKVLLLFIFIFSVSLTVLLMYYEISEVWGALGHDYYECSGVVNGVASGHTWPVPYCFEDQTNLSNVETFGSVGGCDNYDRVIAWTCFSVFHFLYLSIWIGLIVRRKKYSENASVVEMKEDSGMRKRRRSLLGGRNGTSSSNSSSNSGGLELTDMTLSRRKKNRSSSGEIGVGVVLV